MKLFWGCSSETLTEARQVSNLFSSLGLQVWFEEKSIVSGETSENEREAALNSADLIIQVISRKAKNNTEETPPELI